MKIETQKTEWQPVVVTIETREEALALLRHLRTSNDPLGCFDSLYYLLEART